MGFGDLKCDSGLEALNNYLMDKSYIEGYVPSQADVAIYNALKGAPPGKFVHALRWYNHIASYSEDEKLVLPGVQKPLEQYGSQDGGAGKGSSGGEGKAAAAKADDDDDDDFDLFGSDNEEEEEERKRIAAEKKAEAEKSSKKKVVIAKSSLVLDIKPWDDETDMKELERLVRTVESQGLLWGASKLVEVAYGIKKLQISCVVEDDKVGTDFLEDSITGFEDFVQSVDIVAFNKI